MRRWLYTLLLVLILPLIAVRLAWRARKQPAYLNHLAERFGFKYPAASGPVIWVHAVSVGETRAAAPLIQALMTEYPGHRILMTHMTPTGRETGLQLYEDRVLRAYLPYDYPFAVRRFLRHFKPRVAIFMETEIWFNLIHQAHLFSIPAVLANARMSERSARGYRRLGTLTQQALAELTLCAAQTEADADRLRSLGASSVEMTGNLKFDIDPPRSQVELGQVLREKWGRTRKIFLVASTREGEERLLLDALKHLPSDVLIVVVPRHPQRFEEIAGLFRANDISFVRRSSNALVPADVRMVLGDSMGEMFAYYAAADMAFVGGSLLPYGGQNLIEACAVGCPVLIGPHTRNFDVATTLAVESGAAIRVSDAADLATQAARLLEDPALRVRMAQAGLEFSSRHRGATERLMSALRPLLKT